MYDAYHNYAEISDRVRRAALTGERLLREWGTARFVSPFRCVEAYYELVGLAGFTHKRPEFGITQLTKLDGVVVDVVEETVLATPFCNLLRFSRKDSEHEPRVLLVAPMSGHFATLLRGTIQTLLRDHDVYITDWRNTRDIPLDAGVFGVDEFVQHLIDFIKFMGRSLMSWRFASPPSPRLRPWL